MNIKQMAKKAGVSVATISRAMNKETRNKVASETLKKIDELVLKYRYTPSSAAKNLRKSTTKTIGVVFPYVYNIFYSSYYAHILAGISNFLLKTDYGFKLILLKEGKDKLDHYDFKAREGIDGLILTQWFRFFSIRFMSEEINLPCAIINDFDKKIKAHFVCGDNFGGGEIAAKYLYSLGHRSIAVIAGSSWSRDSCERINGFGSYLKEMACPLGEGLVVQGDYDQDLKTYGAVDELLKKIPRITAIFCCNDNMAFAAIRRLKEHGISCPKDISVMGYDDDFRTSSFSPSLSTICVPVYDLSTKASELLIEHLKGGLGTKPLKGETWMPVHLVERNSVRKIQPS